MSGNISGKMLGLEMGLGSLMKLEMIGGSQVGVAVEMDGVRVADGAGP